jgi:rRNA maturation endonuclease Nob1
MTDHARMTEQLKAVVQRALQHYDNYYVHSDDDATVQETQEKILFAAEITIKSVLHDQTVKWRALMYCAPCNQYIVDPERDDCPDCSSPLI